MVCSFWATILGKRIYSWQVLVHLSVTASGSPVFWLSSRTCSLLKKSLSPSIHWGVLINLSYKIFYILRLFAFSSKALMLFFLHMNAVLIKFIGLFCFSLFQSLKFPCVGIKLLLSCRHKCELNWETDLKRKYAFLIYCQLSCNQSHSSRSAHCTGDVGED